MKLRITRICVFCGGKHTEGSTSTCFRCKGTGKITSIIEDVEEYEVIEN